MISSWLGATMALAMMTGVALAQNSPSSTTSTQSTTSAPAPLLGAISVSVTQRTTDSDGVVTERTQTSTSGSTDSPSGDSAPTWKTTETTTVR